MKSSALLYPLNKNNQKLFKDVVFIVDADSYASHSLWVDHFYKPRYKHGNIKTWEQISIGTMLEIGEIDRRPVCINIHDLDDAFLPRLKPWASCY